MVVRFRFPSGANGGEGFVRVAPFVSVLGGLMTMVAVSCLMFALWRLTSDLGWTDTFVISDGILSHWQVWMAMTIAFGVIAFRLARYGRAKQARPDSVTPDIAVPGAALAMADSSPLPIETLGDN